MRSDVDVGRETVASAKITGGRTAGIVGYALLDRPAGQAGEVLGASRLIG